MGAGQPNYQRLNDIGRLPKEARDKIPLLSQLDQAEERVTELEGYLKFALSLMEPEQKEEFWKTVKEQKKNKE